MIIFAQDNKGASMKEHFKVSLYYDTRRQKKDGTYPVKIVVYCSHTKKRRYYPTKFNLSKADWRRAMETTKPRKQYKDLRDKLNAAELYVKNTAKKITEANGNFSLDVLDQRFNVKVSDFKKVSFQYSQVIDRMKRNGQLSTAEIYSLSFKSISDYCDTTGQHPDKITFDKITPDWLEGYERHMRLKGRTANTIGIYLRPLKTIYNKAISENEVSGKLFPFGKKKYKIPASVGRKRALTLEQVQTLLKSEPQTPEQQKAKDFWFLSLYCSGANIADIARWKWKNKFDTSDSGTYIEYYRTKTKSTTKDKQALLRVYLTDYCLQVIEKCGTPPAPENYIFDIIDHSMNPEAKRNSIKAFTRFINQHIKKLAKANGLPEGISTYYARHSFATIGIQNGQSLEFMQRELGHKSMATTQNYFSGFDNETKKQFPNQLQNLIES